MKEEYYFDWYWGIGLGYKKYSDGYLIVLPFIVYGKTISA